MRKALIRTGDWQGGFGVGGHAVNQGDVNLGILGARWGSRFASSPGYLGQDLARDLRNGTGYK